MGVKCKNCGHAIYPDAVNRSVCKLTEEQARAIYRDPRSYAKIAAGYQISPMTVRSIKKGFTWQQIHAEEQPKNV